MTLKKRGTPQTNQARRQLAAQEPNPWRATLTTIATRTTAWRLPPAARKAVLVLHVISGIGWMGVDITLLVLLITARTTDDAARVVSGFNAIGMIVPVAVPPLSLGILVTGVILGLGTRWGLTRYWWVMVKLLLSLIMTVLVFVSLVPAVSDIDVRATTTMSADAVRASLGALPTMLLFPPVVSFLMLGTATILSIFKPWSHTPWSRERRAGVGSRATSSPSSDPL